jgi:adenosylcobinamide-GDP ribazoletransferase
MLKSLNTLKWYDNLWAAFIYFTRLPFWRLRQPPQQSYAAVVEWWPLTGWLTASIMAATIYFGSMILPYPVAIILAIVARLLTTGALHEDGLADFFDGFGGGGSDRERILTIMKDSHIGTFGVVSLIIYFALLFLTLLSLPVKVAALAILAADPFAKMVTSQLILMMPYARTAETAKNRTVYRKPSTVAGICLAVQGLLPFVGFVWMMDSRIEWSTLIFVPCLTMYFLYRMIWGRLKGYTGDCCGAVCLLVELAFYLSLCAQYTISTSA